MDLQLPEELFGRTIVLRRYRLSDSRDLKEAIAASLENLRPWMPWAQSPPTDESVLEFLKPAAEQFGGADSANYAITLKNGGQFAGGCGLMPRIGPEALEIGYWTDARYLRGGIATEAASLLTEAALLLPEVRRVEIHCDEANLESAGIPRRLGFRLDRVEPDEIEAPAEIGRSMIWVAERGVWEAPDQGALFQVID